MASLSSLLVDLGATYVKVAVLRRSGGIVAESKFPFPPFASLDGPHRSVDPAVVLAAVQAAIASVLSRAGNPQRISVQRAAARLDTDRRAQCSPLAAGDWQDQRAQLACESATYLDRLRRTQPAEVWRAVGNELRPGLLVAGIYATNLTAIDGHLRMHSLISWGASALTSRPTFVWGGPVWWSSSRCPVIRESGKPPLACSACAKN